MDIKPRGWRFDFFTFEKETGRRAGMITIICDPEGEIITALENGEQLVLDKDARESLHRRFTKTYLKARYMDAIGLEPIDDIDAWRFR